MPKNKVVPIEEAMSRIESGMSIAVGGFIGQGDPLTLIDYLKTMDVGMIGNGAIAGAVAITAPSESASVASRPPFAITHAPGFMFVTDVPDTVYRKP